MEKSKIIERHIIAEGVHVREAGEGEAPSRVITGYAIMFGVRSAPLWEDEFETAYEVIAPEAVTRELLDKCDIKMTMFHDRQLLLARSVNGSGGLTYQVDERGVCFEFEAPNTVDGDKALELVRRGIISGCSFSFRCAYFDRDAVSREEVENGGKTKITYTVHKIADVVDFTLAADPAYPQTSCEVRELLQGSKPEPAAAPEPESKAWRQQVSDMRREVSEMKQRKY